VSKILIIEDNELHRRLLNDVLDARGYVVLLAETGGSGIELAHREKPDLILLDRGLPDISGLDVARTLKSTPSTRNVPIIAVTAYAMPGDERELIKSGCDAYLSKPFRVRDLLVLVATFLPRPPQI
jgi:two-component system, cell cycle response regulator DivK